MNYTAVFGFFAGITGGIYLVGGFIVNSYLGRYGVVEYQILRAKYLAVGIMYLLYLLAASLWTLIIGIVIAPIVFLFDTDLISLFDAATSLLLLPWSFGFLFLVSAKRPFQIRFKFFEVLKSGPAFIIFTGFMLIFPFISLAALIYELGNPLISNSWAVILMWFL